MKKTKLMALVLVGAISLTGAGYAAWSNTITDTTSINTGNWSVVLENDAPASYRAGDQVNTFVRGGLETPGTADYGSGNNYDNAAAEHNTGIDNYVYTLTPDPVNDNGKIACNFAFTNLHPGTQAMTRFEMRNKGSIPAKIENVHVDFLDANGTALTEAQLAADTNITQVINAMKVNPFFQIHRGAGSLEIPVINEQDIALTDLQEHLNAKMKGLVLKPTDFILSDELESGGGETELNPIFTFRLPGDSLKAATNINTLESNLGQNANFKVRITFDFVQYNDITNSPNTAVTQPAK